MSQDKNIQILKDMRRIITEYQENKRTMGHLASDLDALANLLLLQDSKWSHELVQNILILDSGSTYVPTNEEQTQALVAVTATAVNRIEDLVRDKLYPLVEKKIAPLKEQIELYCNGHISLGLLVNNLVDLHEIIDSQSDTWKQSVWEKIGDLEQVNTAMLDRGMEKIDETGHKIVDETIKGLVELVQPGALH